MLDYVLLLFRNAQEKQRHILLVWFYQFHEGEALRESVVKQISLSHSSDFRYIALIPQYGISAHRRDTDFQLSVKPRLF